jgi:tetratricopeptide (TPR) repeat protein
MLILRRCGIARQTARRLLFVGLLSGVLISTAVRGGAQDKAVSPASEAAIDRARAAQEADRYADAANAYAEATAIDPHVPELWANRGLMEHFAGDPMQAIDSFKHALVLKPLLYTAVLFTGIDYLSLNEPEKALPYLKRARHLKPSNPDTYEALGKAYMALHDPAHAASNYQEAVVRSPQSTASWYGLGVASVALIDKNGGTLAKRHSTTPWSLALYADEMLMQGRPLEAVDAYKQAAAVSSASQRATFVAVLHAMSSPTGDSVDPTISPSSVDRVIAVLQTTPDQDLAVCPDPAKSDQPTPPKNRNSNMQTMVCAYLQRDATGSAAAAANHLASSPDDPESLYWSVKANEIRAVEALAQFEHFAPHSAATFNLVGDLYRRRMQPDSALEEYSKALAIDPHDIPALMGSASAYLSIGNMEKSVAAVEVALADSPDNPRLNLLMGESLVNLHHYPDAKTYLERCIAATRQPHSDPGTLDLAPRAHALLGRVEAGLGDVPDAISEMNLGLASDQDGSLHFQLSRLYRQQGKLADAKAAETKAAELMAQRRVHAVIAVRSSTESLP